MGAVDVGIGHENDFTVSQFIIFEFGLNPGSQGGNDVFNFRIGVNLVLGGGFDIEYFAPDRQNRLGFPVTCLLAGTSRRISFANK